MSVKTNLMMQMQKHLSIGRHIVGPRIVVLCCIVCISNDFGEHYPIDYVYILRFSILLHTLYTKLSTATGLMTNYRVILTKIFANNNRK